MKIAFIGAPSTDKSAKALNLAKRSKGILSNDLFKDCPFPIKKECSRSSQEWIFASLWKSEIELSVKAQREQRSLICDRTLFDCFCHCYDRGFDDLCGFWYAFVQEEMHTFNSIYWCRPSIGTPAIRKGIQDIDPLWQSHIDTIFQKFIKLMGIQVTKTLRPDPQK